MPEAVKTWLLIRETAEAVGKVSGVRLPTAEAVGYKQTKPSGLLAHSFSYGDVVASDPSSRFSDFQCVNQLSCRSALDFRHVARQICPIRSKSTTFQNPYVFFSES